LTARKIQFVRFKDSNRVLQIKKRVGWAENVARMWAARNASENLKEEALGRPGCK
jgi:hypothetical protein